MKNNKYILLPALFHQHLFYLKQSRRSHAPQDKANAELLLPEQRLYAVPCTRASQKSTPYEGSLTGRHGRPRLNLWCVRFARSRPRSRPEFKLERYDDIITDNLISTEYVHLPITGIFRRGRCSHLSFEPSRPPLAEAVSDLLSQGHLLQYLARPYLDRRRMVTCTMAWPLRGNRIACLCEDAAKATSQTGSFAYGERLSRRGRDTKGSTDRRSRHAGDHYSTPMQRFTYVNT
jgi:hypothetical protein